jgi:hypothetical protein
MQLDQVTVDPRRRQGDADGRRRQARAGDLRIRGLAEPLYTVMRIAAWSEVVVGRLAAGRLKASSRLTDEPLPVRWIEDGELRAVDPHLRALHNVHVPEDLSP